MEAEDEDRASALLPSSTAGRPAKAARLVEEKELAELLLDLAGRPEKIAAMSLLKKAG